MVSTILQSGRKISTQAEWMHLNLEELVAAIKEDGRLCGPKSEPLLQNCAMYSGDQRVAKHILFGRLMREGLQHLLPKGN